MFGASKDDDDDDDDDDKTMMNGYENWLTERENRDRNEWMRKALGQSKEDEEDYALNRKENSNKKTVIYSPSQSFASSNEKVSAVHSTVMSNSKNDNDNNNGSDKGEISEKNTLKGLLLWNHDNSVDYYDIREKTRVSHHIHHIHHIHHSHHSHHIYCYDYHGMMISLHHSIDYYLQDFKSFMYSHHHILSPIYVQSSFYTNLINIM